MKKNIYILGLILLTINSLNAQKMATGSWYGRADVEMAGMHNNYLTELIIRQKGNKVDGIFGYYFKDKYTSFFVHGHYNVKTREIRILNIPVIYFNSNSTANSVDCNTNFLGTLMVSRVRTSLSGYFYHDEKHKYTCPDLRVHYTLDKGDQKQDSLLSKATAGTRIWKPEPEDFIVNASETKNADTLSAMKKEDSLSEIVTTNATNKGTPGVSTTVTTVSTGTGAPTVADATASSLPKKDLTSVPPAVSPEPPVKNDLAPVPTLNHADSLAASAAVAAAKAKEEMKIAAAKAAEQAKVDAKKIAESFAKRKTTLTKELEVESDSVRVSFYDNGIIDGDSISVFLNHQLILSHQELAAKALTIYVHLDSLKEVNEISMFAENLGKYPPNTALMVVTDGINRYEVFMSSSLTQNASILLKRRKEQ